MTMDINLSNLYKFDNVLEGNTYFILTDSTVIVENKNNTAILNLNRISNVRIIKRRNYFRNFLVLSFLAFLYFFVISIFEMYSILLLSRVALLFFSVLAVSCIKKYSYKLLINSSDLTFKEFKIAQEEIKERFGEQFLSLRDPDGLNLDLVIPAHRDDRAPWVTGEVSNDVATRGFHSITLTVRKLDPTAAILTDILGYSLEAQEGNRYRFKSNTVENAAIVDIIEDGEGRPGVNAAGTNHHVAFGVIQYNSKPGRDLIQDGYIAADRAAELPANPDYRVLVTTGFDKVTDRILADARGKQGRAYFDAVDTATKAVVAECERDAGYRCSVANMYYGTDFYLVKQLELRDVRLVYAPPNDIGNYGDEIDNFMWPRHTGDFTLLRAYVGKDGKPADYSPDNVPYVPPSHLQVSTRNVKEGDYAMLAGYPGTTYRHRMASEFANQIEWQLPSRVALFDGMIKTIEAASANDEDARVRYASQVKSFKNSLKRAQGELDGLRRSNAVSVRREDETAMYAWLERQSDAAAIRTDIAAAQAVLDRGVATRERDQLLAAINNQTQLLRSAITLQRLAHERTKPDAQRESGYQQRDEVLITGQLKQVQRRYSPAVEKALLAHLLAQYQALPADQHVAEYDAVFGTTAEQAKAKLDALYAGTGLGEEAARLQAMQADVATLQASKDPLLQAAATLLPAVLRLDDESKTSAGELLRLRLSERLSVARRRSLVVLVVCLATLGVALVAPGATVVGEVADLTNGVIYTIEGDGLNATLSFASTIPIAGWFSAGVKFAKRADGLAYTVKAANNLISFGKIGINSPLCCIKTIPMSNLERSKLSTMLNRIISAPVRLRSLVKNKILFFVDIF